MEEFDTWYGSIAQANSPLVQDCVPQCLDTTNVEVFVRECRELFARLNRKEYKTITILCMDVCQRLIGFVAQRLAMDFEESVELRYWSSKQCRDVCSEIDWWRSIVSSICAVDGALSANERADVVWFVDSFLPANSWLESVEARAYREVLSRVSEEQR